MLSGIETITYKPKNSNYTYIGTVEKSDADGCFHGKVLDIESVILYEGITKEELTASFHTEIDRLIEVTQESKSSIGFHEDSDIKIKCAECAHNIEYNLKCLMGFQRIYCGVNNYGMIECAYLTDKE